eukprot:scaffold17539_cov182-Skeletonema_marinoi.AAC.5
MVGSDGQHFFSSPPWPMAYILLLIPTLILYVKLGAEADHPCHNSDHAAHTTNLTMSTSSTLPQPPLGGNEQPYSYVPYDGLETDWLGDELRLRSCLINSPSSESNDKANCNHGGRYAPGTLVWVLLSKKKPKDAQNCNSGFHDTALHKKRRNKKNKGSGSVDAESEETNQA